jgi:hypothetical protein
MCGNSPPTVKEEEEEEETPCQSIEGEATISLPSLQEPTQDADLSTTAAPGASFADVEAFRYRMMWIVHFSSP